MGSEMCIRDRLLLTDRSGFVHLGEDLTITSLFKKEIWRGKSNFDLLREREISVSELPSVFFPWLVLACPAAAIFTMASGYPRCAMYLLLITLLPGLLYALRLKFRSGAELGLHKLMTFYSVYFFARGIGMTQRMFERNAYLHAGVRTP